MKQHNKVCVGKTSDWVTPVWGSIISRYKMYESCRASFHTFKGCSRSHSQNNYYWFLQLMLFNVSFLTIWMVMCGLWTHTVVILAGVDNMKPASVLYTSALWAVWPWWDDETIAGTCRGSCCLTSGETLQTLGSLAKLGSAKFETAHLQSRQG